MVLETLDQTAGNIKNFVLEEPNSPGVPFNPEKDISPARWAEMKTYLNNWRQDFTEDQPDSMRGHYWTEKLPAAVPLAILFPKEKGKLIVDFGSQEEVDRILNERTSPGKYSLGILLSSMKIAWGMTPQELGLNEGLFNNFKSTLNSLRDNRAFFLHHAANTKILFPQMQIDTWMQEDVWNKIKSDIEQSRKNPTPSITGWLAETLANLRIYAPERIDYLRNDSKVWRALKYGLEQQVIPRFYTKFAADMKILAADEVIITDTGIELVMPAKPFETSPLPVPERRKF